MREFKSSTCKAVYVQKYNIITLANKLYQYNIRLYIVREQDTSVIYNWPKAKSDREVNKYWTVEIEYYNPRLIVFVAALQIKGIKQTAAKTAYYSYKVQTTANL